MLHSEHTTHTVASRGQAIYQQLSDTIEQCHTGKFLAIDIETEDYEIDGQGTAAINRLLSKHPDAVIYLIRIGHRTAYQVGFRNTFGTLTNKIETDSKLLK